MIAAGDLYEVLLPPLEEVTGYDPIIEGYKYFNLTRALGPDFDMRGYWSKHLGMWRRTTWSSAYGTFY